MANSYFPSNDSAFSDWIDRFLSYVGAHQAALGLDEDDLDQIVIDHPKWDTSHAAHQTAQNAAKSACTAKNADRNALEATVRILARKIKANPAVTDAMLEALGLKAKESDVYVASALSESGDRPLGIIDISNPLRHVIRIENVNSTGTSKGKPAGALGCEVWNKVGEPPSETGGDLAFLGVVTNNRLVVNYPATEGGKQAYYKLRWVNGRGEKSAWSDAETATIAA